MLKLFIRYLQLKKKGYNKEMRMVDYAINEIITFEQYDKYFNKKVKGDLRGCNGRRIYKRSKRKT